jgi:hypothetical protein
MSKPKRKSVRRKCKKTCSNKNINIKQPKSLNQEKKEIMVACGKETEQTKQSQEK